MSIVHLIFPPVWVTEIPYLSLPALTAYLRSRTDATVRAFDLNIAFWWELRSPASLENLWRWARRRVSELDPASGMIDLAMVLRLSQIAQLELDTFLSAVRSGAVPLSIIDANLKLWFREERLGRPPLIGTKQWEAEYDYHDPLFSAISLSGAASSAEGIAEAVTVSRGNPYREMLPALYERAAGTERPDLVGLSVTAVNQVIPAFTLADWIKRCVPNCRIILGGAWCTHLSDDPNALAPLFEWVDAVVAGEGERPLVEIVERIRAGAAVEDIAGVYTLNGHGVRAPAKERRATPLDDLPTPDFDDLPLDSYDFPRLLPLQASRGCSWGRCTFCSYVTLDPVYHVRAVENVAADLETLARRYGALEVAFSDSLMQPDYFFRLSEEVIRRGLRVKWRGFGRFDRRFTPEVLRTLARAGCHYIIWGMESASPSILKAMRKGNTPAIIHQNLRDAAEAGVHSRACLIYGFPGETPEDSDQTIAFLRERKQWVDSIAFCHYTALRDTPMTREPQQFGLCIRRETQPFALEIAKAPLDASYLEETEQRLRSLWLEIGRRRRSFLQERSLEGTHAEDTL